MPTKTSGGLSPVKHGLDRMWAALEGRRMLDMTVLMIAGSTAVLTVLGLSDRRGPAPEAQLLYREDLIDPPGMSR